VKRRRAAVPVLRLAAEDPCWPPFRWFHLWSRADHAGEPAAAGGPAPRRLEEALARAGRRRAGRCWAAPLDLRANRRRPRANWPRSAGGGGGAPSRRTAALPSGTAAESRAWFAQAYSRCRITAASSLARRWRPAGRKRDRDSCKGAGGKTLALAAALENRGHLLACDIDRPRLSRLPERAAGGSHRGNAAARLDREAAMLADWAGRADAVLIDAALPGPGIGTGGAIRGALAVVANAIARMAATQARLLRVAPIWCVRWTADLYRLFAARS
jgi:16S rRNA (cytosine967-C5)-methyltransferase